MKHLNNELGKLRQEVKIGFIEVDNRFQSVNDGFEVIQNFLSQQLDQQDNRLTSLEKRMDQAGL